jgi:IS5 family transposase
MAGKQRDISDYEQTTAKNRSKKEKFLADMDQIVPWQHIA